MGLFALQILVEKAEQQRSQAALLLLEVKAVWSVGFMVGRFNHTFSAPMFLRSRDHLGTAVLHPLNACW